MTVKYLSNTVKRQTGKSVTYYIDRYTVPMIKEYLNNPDLSIVQIAEEMNFTTLSYFSRYVTKHLGMSPKAYRESLMPRDQASGHVAEGLPGIIDAAVNMDGI